MDSGFFSTFFGWLPHVQLAHFLIVSAFLFALGLYGIITRRNAILVLMGVELVLNAANINLIAFSRYGTLKLDGQGPGDCAEYLQPVPDDQCRRCEFTEGIE
jgi:multisubunit Na+/H+ antiporter MnhC subunit